MAMNGVAWDLCYGSDDACRKLHAFSALFTFARPLATSAPL